MTNNIISTKDIQVVNSFINLQTKHIKENESWYHPWYLNGYNKLYKESFSIETFEKKLKSIDWDFKFVDGYLSGFEYFKCLGNQILPVINNVRDGKQLLYADFPDMIHDVIGHAPMLFNKDYTSFLKNIYNFITEIDLKDIDVEYLSLQGVTKKDRERNLIKLNQLEEHLEKTPTLFYKLNNIALWTVEFGVLEYGNTYKAYGAAIVASPLEINNLFNKKIPVKNLLNISNPSFNFSALQNELYVTKDLESILHFMLRTSSNFNKVKC